MNDVFDFFLGMLAVVLLTLLMVAALKLLWVVLWL